MATTITTSFILIFISSSYLSGLKLLIRTLCVLKQTEEPRNRLHQRPAVFLLTRIGATPQALQREQRGTKSKSISRRNPDIAPTSPLDHRVSVQPGKN